MALPSPMDISETKRSSRLCVCHGGTHVSLNGHFCWRSIPDQSKTDWTQMEFLSPRCFLIRVPEEPVNKGLNVFGQQPRWPRRSIQIFAKYPRLFGIDVCRIPD